jgi:hypothetical protein
LRLSDRLQFKCDLEQNKFSSPARAGKVILWKYEEIVEHNTEKIALSDICTEVETEGSHSQRMTCSVNLC